MVYRRKTTSPQNVPTMGSEVMCFHNTLVYYTPLAASTRASFFVLTLTMTLATEGKSAWALEHHRAWSSVLCIYDCLGFR